jgi:hypothetical protein
MADMDSSCCPMAALLRKAFLSPSSIICDNHIK